MKRRFIWLFLLLFGLLSLSCGGAKQTNKPAEPAKTPRVAQEQPEKSAKDVTSSGRYVADLGFRPKSNSFSFENYGDEGNYRNLTVAEMQRLFGDKVCANKKKGKCILTAAAKEWMKEANESMAGGHCEGMAVTSLLFYTKKLDPNDFGAESVPDLELEGNNKLQREIAYWWATQMTNPTMDSEIAATPSQILDVLLKQYRAGAKAPESYTIGIFKRDWSGGHAITPYAVEDQGKGIFWIMVYDNNYPQIVRKIEVNRNKNTWSYQASTNPKEESELYEGDAGTQTLTIVPTSKRLRQQVCGFCNQEAKNAQNTRGQKEDKAEFNEIWVSGQADLLITDEQGRRYGFADGKPVKEIPGAKVKTFKFGVDVWDLDSEPTYYVPLGVKFRMTLDGSRLKKPSKVEIAMIGPGYVLDVFDIQLKPNQKDTLDVSPDGNQLSYKTTVGETPNILVGFETLVADYSFLLKGFALEPGGAVNVVLNVPKGRFIVNTVGNKQVGKYSLLMDRVDIDSEDELIFGHDGIELQPNDTAHLLFRRWRGNGGTVPLEVDHGSDGSIDKTIELTDMTDEFSE